MFTGLSAFSLTPLDDDGAVDAAGLQRLVGRLVDAGVDSIGALGSTGSSAYLTREERARVTALAVEVAGDVPVMVGIGATRTEHALALADDAQAAGAAALMLAPVTYQPLTDDEVLGLFADVAAAASGALGVSGDAAAARGLAAGADVWFSGIAGLLPELALKILRDGDDADAAPLWDLVARHGSVRVIATAAVLLGLAGERHLPRPLRMLDGDARDAVATAIAPLTRQH